jgi:hypothetical protein
MTDETRTGRPPLWRRRWVWVLAAVLVVLRAALPEVVRRVLGSQVSQTLGTRVEVGDVDLALHRGGVALEDVALYSPTPAEPNEPPLVAWKRFAIELRYLPLLWRTAQLRKIELDSPRVALDRLANGELNLRRLVPASEPQRAANEEPARADEAGPGAPPPGEAPPRGSDWKIGVDHFALRAGGIRFRDLTLPEGTPLEIAIPDVTVDDVALQPGLYGEPARARLRVKSEGGGLRIDARLWVLEKGFALATRLKALHLPLRHARLYIPGVGWSELTGLADAALDYGLAPAPGERNEVRGIVRLRDVAIRVPGLEHAAFTLERLAVRVDPVDLHARRAVVRLVDIGGAAVVVDLQGGEILPLLPRRAVSETAAPAPAPTGEQPAPEAAPWHWRLASLALERSRVRLLQEGAPLDVGVRVAARDLADDAERPGHVDVTLTVTPGSVAVSGAARVTPPGFGGTVRVDELPVHDLARAARAAARLPPGLLQSAVLGAELVIEAGLAESGAEAAADALGVRGRIALDGVRLAAADPREFAVSWQRFEVPLDEVRVPGVVTEAPAGAAAASLRVALGAVRLEEPSVQVTRTAEGVVLPPPLGQAPAEERPAQGSPQEGKPAEAKPTQGRPVEAAPEEPARKVAVEVASFVLSRGRVGLADRTVRPVFSGEIKALDIEARGIRSEGPTIERLLVSASTPHKGKIDVRGSLRPEGSTLEVNGTQVALAPYNPFVTAFSPYSLGARSALSVRTKLAMATGRYDADTSLTLHRLTVKGAQGDTLFKQQFGIPLSVALALLRDLKGDIRLDIPITVDQSGTSVGLGPVIAGAFRSALLGAVTSPLKMIGAAIGSGDEDIELGPIAAQTGRSLLTLEGEQRVGQLAELLAARPGIALELDGVVTASDARWLREQDLRADLDARTGMVNALLGLPERRARLRIEQALAARADGKPGELSADDARLLDEWLGERPPLAPERLRTLATERANAVVVVLRDRHGIEGKRLAVGEAKGETGEGQPGVAVTFGALED